MFSFDVSPFKIQGFGCIAGDPVCVGAPGQAIGDVNPKIPGASNSFQDMTMETVLCINWFPGTSHLNLALLGDKLHVPISLRSETTQTVCQCHVEELRCSSHLR